MATKKIACLGDSSDHGGFISSTPAGKTVRASGALVVIDGDEHTCPIGSHGITPVTAITTKTFNGGVLVLTEDAIAGCGAKITPPDRGVYVE